MELYDIKYSQKNGSDSSSVLSKLNSLCQYHGIVDDIMNKIHDKDTQYYSRGFIQELLGSIHEGLCILNDEGKIIISNSHFFDILDIEKKEGNIQFIIKDHFFAGDIIKFIGSNKRDLVREGRIFQNNNEYRDISIKLSRIKESEYILFLIRDFTEKNRLLKDISRNSRLMAMGEMIAQISHEIKNPLGSMELFATLLYKDLYSEESKKLLENIIIMIKRLDRILNSMLNFSKPMKQVFVQMDINNIIQETVDFVRVLTDEKNLIIKTELCSEGSQIEIDPELIRQVIYNLLLNSYQASEENKQIYIKSSNYFDKENGQQMLQMDIIDYGLGIERRNLSSIFDPFFTTKADGNGLGLPIVNKIVEIHNGFLKIKSQKDKGTIISVFLPKQQKIKNERGMQNESITG